MSDVPPQWIASLLVAAVFLSLGLTRIMIGLGPKLGLMDEPEARRVHVSPIPRAGGIAIWLTFMAVTWFISLFFPDAFNGKQMQQLQAFSISSAFLMVIGLIDDRWGMKSMVKLAGQITAATLFYWLEPSLHGKIPFFSDVPVVLAGLFFVGWCVVFINAFNLIDGLDGLCSGLVLVSLISLGALGFLKGASTEAIVVFLMAASVLGFLRYNLNPARIFLGDAGSMMLGFFLATSAPNVVGEKAAIGVMVLPIAIAGVPLLDVILAIWRRSIRKRLNHERGQENSQGIFKPDRDHLHHRFLDTGMTQSKVALLLQALAVLLAALGLLPLIIGGRGLAITFIGFFVLGLIGIRHLARVELVQSGSILHLAVRRRQGRRAGRFFRYLYDVLALALAGWLGMIIETNYGYRNESGVWSLNFFFLFVLTEIVVLQMIRIYRRVWSRATLREFFVVASSLTAGAILVSGLWSFFKADVTWSDFRCGFVASQIAVWLVLLPRAMPEAIRELVIDSRHRRSSDADAGEEKRQVVVYGAGTRGNLFIGYVKSCEPEEYREFQIVGFVDDNKALHQRFLQGFKILGGLDSLSKLIKRRPLHGIIITITDLQPEILEKIHKIASQLDLKVYEWALDPLPRELFPESTAIPAREMSPDQEPVQ